MRLQTEQERHQDGNDPDLNPGRLGQTTLADPGCAYRIDKRHCRLRYTRSRISARGAHSASLRLSLLPDVRFRVRSLPPGANSRNETAGGFILQYPMRRGDASRIALNHSNNRT